jgi:hypothetical protein
MCKIPSTRVITLLVCRTFLAFFVSFVGFCTFYDFVNAQNKSETFLRIFAVIPEIKSVNNFFIFVLTDGYINAFSLIKNVEDLLSTKENPNDIQTVHGLRFLMAIVLMIT